MTPGTGQMVALWPVRGAPDGVLEGHLEKRCFQGVKVIPETTCGALGWSPSRRRVASPHSHNPALRTQKSHPRQPRAGPSLATALQAPAELLTELDGRSYALCWWFVLKAHLFFFSFSCRLEESMLWPRPELTPLGDSDSI